jgi:DNA (cytosine-5)-methyltransferase 1
MWGLIVRLADVRLERSFRYRKNKDAFNTLATNLVGKRKPSFSWPEWLPKKTCTTSTLLSKYSKQLAKLKGKIDLLAGAPPCQGFSLAGRRIYSDPRNTLFRQYLAVVKRLKPRFILLENVQGFDFPFTKNGNGIEKKRPYSQILKQKLEAFGYIVFPDFLDFSDFGVPQHRCRFILIAIKKNDPALLKLKGRSPFDLLKSTRETFLRAKGLPADKPVSCKQAIRDLETHGRTLEPAPQERIRAFLQLKYRRQASAVGYIGLMREKTIGAPDSLRLHQREDCGTENQMESSIGVGRNCIVGQSLR